MRVLLAALLFAALAAGCDDNGQQLSRGDVKQAFESQGFDLAGPVDPDGPLWVASRAPASDSSAYDGAIYVPRTGDPPFLILVYDRENDADNAFQTLRSQATSASFEIQKANVVVTSDEGVTAPMRKRIRAALAELE